MEPRISLVTLAVEDLATSRAFYEALGWRVVFSDGQDVVFFDLGGLVFGLYRRTAMAAELACPPDILGPGGSTLAYNTRSHDEVDTALAAAEAAGATVRAPIEREWGGYSGYFADPDGHLWEVAWNPHWPIAEDGRVQFPAP